MTARSILISLLLTLCLSAAGCGSITVIRHYGVGDKSPTIKVEKHIYKQGLRSRLRTYL